MAKFTASWEVSDDDSDLQSEETFAESIEEEAEQALMDLGYSNVEVRIT